MKLVDLFKERKEFNSTIHYFCGYDVLHEIESKVLNYTYNIIKFNNDYSNGNKKRTNLWKK